MIENIPIDQDYVYYHNNYVFYKNTNFHHGENMSFPWWFTMACYNDENRTLIFMGLSSSPSDETVEEINNDWGQFIKKYYGEYYNFDE